MLPPGFERRTITYIEPAAGETDMSTLTPEQRQILKILREKGRASLSGLERALGKAKARQITDRLLDAGLVTRSAELQKPRIGPKTVPYVKLSDRARCEERLATERTRLHKSRAHKQTQVLDFLAGQTQPVPLDDLRRDLACSLTTIRALEKRDLVSIEEIRTRRNPLSRLSLPPSAAPPLTPSQEVACRSIVDASATASRQGARAPVFLLFGVTGSGKTEVYLRVLAQVLASGRRGICLVPEIALTRQTVERFAGRFPGRVGVLHSGLSPGEQFDEWQWIMEGNCDVVIGARSALFAPLPDPGLIIIDEEHEWTYKQEDKSPRYHARDVAIRLAQLTGAAVILGSATPDIGSFHRAQTGEYQLRGTEGADHARRAFCASRGQHSRPACRTESGTYEPSEPLPDIRHARDPGQRRAGDSVSQSSRHSHLCPVP